MNVHSEKDGKLDVKGYLGNVGHDIEPSLLRLNKNQEELLKSLLNDKIVKDEAPCFYNGFRAVFPSARAKLHYCIWHVDQTFMRATTRLEERLAGDHSQTTAVLNTTMISERWHLRIKEDFLQRNINARADFLVDRSMLIELNTRSTLPQIA
ncbi:hypothetical protein OESDEN_03631 [Oesophagostomum dentatum]|uniref:MULE transposase domain-containing protein n=1 Tax=Oesophagostomum dentatum TaxID=61180 RepID=A0A0B1TLX3_OESDE|nr:hypothetical protein OESDEN_03631 [Oesophagostomum dentatum]